MTRFKLRSIQRGYDWGEVITEYLGNNEVRVMDEVVIMNPKVDKAAECIYSQLIAESWGIA